MDDLFLRTHVHRAERAVSESEFPVTRKERGEVIQKICSTISWMPTVLKVGPYRFFFYASDRGEPPHVHAERENMVAKFWLDPARLSRSGDFGRAEIRRIEQLIEQHKPMLLEAWHDFFDH